MTLTFKQVADQDEVTLSPVVLNINSKTGVVGTNYKHDLNKAMKDTTEQIDNFESNGIGWIVDKFKTLDLKIATYVLLELNM